MNDCEKITSMELCANVPGCIFCLEPASFFSRRVLKSPLPNIDAGDALPKPIMGKCSSGLITNQCPWFAEESDQSNGYRQELPTILIIFLLLCFF